MKRFRIRNTLRYSYIEGTFASGMIGFTQDFFTPFILVLGATVRQVGLLSALPNFFASLVQLKSADITERFKSRKKTIFIFAFLQACMLFPLVFISLHETKPLIPIFFVILYTSCGAIVNPAWGSLMSDLIPCGKRGRFFGWRNRVMGLVTVFSGFLAGFILFLFKKVNVYYGFAFIFGAAGIFRFISWYFLNKMYEPRLEIKEEHYFSFYAFISRIRQSNFAKFVVFVSLMSFSVNLASPYFAVFMLKDLHFNYLLYSIITVTATLTVNLMMVRWGHHADKVGNLKIIKFTAPLIGLVPFLWLICRHPAFLIFAQVVSGFVWAGFNICTSNFIYDAVMPQKRTRCIAYFNFINGLALCSGALIGGFILPKLCPILGYKIMTLFLISSLLRFLIGAIMPSMLKEVRPVHNVNHNELFFSVVGIKPIIGIDRRDIRY